MICEIDPQTHERKELDPGYLKRCNLDYAELIGFINDIERGIVIFTFRDYREMPNRFVDAFSIYKEIKAERIREMEEEAKQKKRRLNLN